MPNVILVCIFWNCFWKHPGAYCLSLVSSLVHESMKVDLVNWGETVLGVGFIGGGSGFLRKKLAINNTCDLILAGEAGDNLFISSRSRTQMFENREMCLDSLCRFVPCSTEPLVKTLSCFLVCFPNPSKPHSSLCDQRTAGAHSGQVNGAMGQMLGRTSTSNNCD